ncbi:hypothetical protein [Streptomyces sp. NPDC089799]|uniref:hypothetical protein n=1 Tax=Streptomyces sp. NPDC089799 TaxID=3155066 RepID=UPI00341E856A
MLETKRDRLARLYAEYEPLPFPPGFTRREPDGHCMAMMDSMLSGCISTAMAGPLDDWRRQVLQVRTPLLGEILPLIGDDAYATKYFTYLYEMAVLAIELDNARRE